MIVVKIEVTVLFRVTLRNGGHSCELEIGSEVGEGGNNSPVRTCSAAIPARERKFQAFPATFALLHKHSKRSAVHGYRKHSYENVF